jgi:hypothetical protein
MKVHKKHSGATFLCNDLQNILRLNIPQNLCDRYCWTRQLVNNCILEKEG